MNQRDLITEIEHGPLRDVLRPHWEDVFERHPVLGDKLKHREGRLKSDAAFAIHKLLTDGGEQSRSVAIGWGNDWPWKEVLRAHAAKRKGK